MFFQRPKTGFHTEKAGHVLSFVFICLFQSDLRVGKTQKVMEENGGSEGERKGSEERSPAVGEKRPIDIAQESEQVDEKSKGTTHKKQKLSPSPSSAFPSGIEPRETATVIEGDLLEFPSLFEDVLICHQCNTTTVGARGIAKAIFAKWPDSNVYKLRKSQQTRDVMGSISVSPPVCNMFSQNKPGKPKGQETKEQRYLWLKSCLGEILTKTTQKLVAFPHQVGCGLAGGDWNVVKGILDDFASQMKNQSRVVVVVHKEEKI